MTEESKQLKRHIKNLKENWDDRKKGQDQVTLAGESIYESMNIIHDFLKEIMKIEQIPILLELRNKFKDKWDSTNYQTTKDQTTEEYYIPISFFEALFIFKSYANMIELFFAQISMYSVNSKVTIREVFEYVNIKKMRDVASKINAGLISPKPAEMMFEYGVEGIEDWMNTVVEFMKEAEKNMDKLTPPGKVVSELLRIYEGSRDNGR